MAKYHNQNNQFSWRYDLVVWAISILGSLFYREISCWGLENIPRAACTMFVAAPHSNDVYDFSLASSMDLF
jgi:1-acyl-sn-glycerol-3-phosphate acyltransferase